MSDLEELRAQLQVFASDRDWDQFHSPKNLAMALTVEAAELQEHFQWLTDLQSQSLEEEVLSEVSNEMADVLLYLIRLADRLDVNLLQAAKQKLLLNAAKYPVETSRGSSVKYTKLKP
jgi:dCTP diphosphatase